MTALRLAVVAFAAWGWISPAGAEQSARPPPPSAGYQATSDLSRNPDDIEVRLAGDDEAKDSALRFPRLDALFDPWYAFKADLDRNHGLKFGIAYTGLYQKATTSPGESNAAGGIAELLGTWEFLGRDSGMPSILGFRVENRHSIETDVAPQSLGSEIGSLWPTGFGYGTFELSLAELWWEQYLIEDRLGFRVGKVLPFSIYDYFRFKSPKTGFTNATFTLNPTIAFPSFGLGAAAVFWPLEEVYVTAGIHDANGRPTKTRSAFDSFFNDAEYFSVGEIGWAPGYRRDPGEGPLGAGDYHVTLWHAEKRSEINTPGGWGVTVAGEQQIDDVVLFLRYGYSEDTALLHHMVAGGIGLLDVFGESDDVVGLGLSWGESQSSSLNVTIGDDRFKIDVQDVDQYAGELYYRVQLTPRLSVTPSAQLILDPADNREKDSIGVFGIRGRFSL